MRITVVILLPCAFVDITLGEPAPSLFQPPADYNLIEESGPFVLRLKL